MPDREKRLVSTILKHVEENGNHGFSIRGSNTGVMMLNHRDSRTLDCPQMKPLNLSVGNQDESELAQSPYSPPRIKACIAEVRVILWDTAHYEISCGGNYRKEEGDGLGSTQAY